jgi:CRP-like cAMP-binding protein
MAEFLKFLTAEDRVRVMARAERLRFEPEQVILAQGEHRHALFVLESGEARVERRHDEVCLEIARLSAGEIFGEMSFVEEFEASASVVADTACEVSVVGAEHVRAMIEETPDFYGRFYQSIAKILSRRLRETTEAGIAEYSWGGLSRPAETDSELEPIPGWGGGSPFGDALPPQPDGGS